MKIITVILLSLLSFQSLAQEVDEIQYVTDKLYLSLYEQADSGSKVIKSIVSGERLEVLEIAGPYASVITENGKEGWVKKGFLVKTKTASILFKEADEALKALQEKVDINKENNGSFEEMKLEFEALQQENKQLKQIKEIFLRQKELNGEASGLIDDEQQIKKEPENKINLDLFIAFLKEYALFLIASLILLILIGYRFGELKTESDVIKHFGGVKVW